MDFLRREQTCDKLRVNGSKMVQLATKQEQFIGQWPVKFIFECILTCLFVFNKRPVITIKLIDNLLGKHFFSCIHWFKAV